MHDIETAVLPGTKIIIVPHEDNPAEKEANQVFFKDKYWEVVVISDGSNPQFPNLMWRILLVTPNPGYRMPTHTEGDYTVVSIEDGTIIKRAETVIEEVAGICENWPSSGLKLHLSSHAGEEVAFFSCAPLPVTPPTGATMQ